MKKKEATWKAKDLSWIMAALTPWADVPDPLSKKPGGRTDPFGAEVAREGIKLPSKQCDIVSHAFRNRKSIMAAKKAVLSGESWILARDKLGMEIRRWGPTWKLQVRIVDLIV